MENEKHTIFEKVYWIVGITLIIIMAIGAFKTEEENQSKKDESMILMEQSLKLQQEQIEILKNLEVKVKIK